MKLRLDKLKELIEADMKRRQEMERMLKETYALRQMVGKIIPPQSSLDNLPPSESIFE